MRLVAWLFAALVLVAPARAAQSSLDGQALAKSEAAIGKPLPRLTFVDTDRAKVTLAGLRGKPLLISLVYTGCADVCPTIIENLRAAIEVGQSALGTDSFTTVTIGFDTRHDTPERMRSFARSHGIDLANWLFLSGDQGTVTRLADAVGFMIVPSTGGFDHMAQVSIVDADGRIYQQVRGSIFDPPSIVEPLKELLFGQRRSILSLKGISERIKLFCTVYNPNTGRYYFNYSLFIGIGIGMASLLLVLGWLVKEARLTGGRGGQA